MSETAPKEQRDDRWASRDPSEVRAYYESHLEAAEREVERLRTERDEALRAASDNLHSFKLMEKSRDNWREASDRKLGRIEKLSREVERLREALERLLDNGDAPHPLSGRDPTVRWDDVEHARAALAQPTEGQEREPLTTEPQDVASGEEEGVKGAGVRDADAARRVAGATAQPTEGQERE